MATLNNDILGIGNIPSVYKSVRPIFQTIQSTGPMIGSNDFKTLFYNMYLLNRDLNQGIIKISQNPTLDTMTIAGVGNVNITNAMGQFVLTTTLGEYENIVSAASNLMEAQRKIEDYLQKIV